MNGFGHEAATQAERTLSGRKVRTLRTMTKVSVVIPAFEARAFIERPVRSLLQQSHPHWEAIIVSDDGHDYLSELRAQDLLDPRFRQVFTGQRGSGAARARNTGLDAASESIVATLDSDDAWEPDALALLLPYAQTHGAAYSAVRLLDHETGAELPNRDRPLPSGPVALEDILTSQIHTYAGIMFDRSRIRARWPQWMQRWEDVYFYVQCFDDVDHLYHVALPLYRYHRREGSICNRATTAEEYSHWAASVAARIEAGDTVGINSSAARATFRRYLESRHALEDAFARALAADPTLDFQDFLARHPELLYRLDTA